MAKHMYTQFEHDACGIGTIVNIDGRQDHRVVDDALHIVEKLEHRAGKDATGEVGDGVGILTQIPHGFFAKAAEEAGITLTVSGEAASGSGMTVSKPAQAGDYGIGMFFLPQDTLKRTFAIRMFEVIAQKEGLEVLGWRDVPVREQILGKAAVDCMPCIRQCFLARPADVERGIAFDRRLYVVRREFEQSSEDTYICSLSSRTIVYKGMFLVGQLRRFYDDLQSPDYVSAIAIVLGFFKIPLTQIIEIRFMVLPVAAAGWLFGPVVGGLVGIVADVGGYLIKPTGPFFPGFTITSMLSGVIFGCVLYRRRPTLLRIFTAQVIYTLVCGLLLTSIWLSMLYGNGFIPVLTARILKELVLIPVNTIMLAALMEPVRRFRMTQGMTS